MIPAPFDAGWLKSELEKPGRSQSALARWLHVDPSAVNKLCNGTRQPKAAELPVIEEYLRGAPAAAACALPKVHVHLDADLLPSVAAELMALLAGHASVTLNVE